MLSSALTYISEIKTYTKEKYKYNSIWNWKNEDWYTIIRSKIIKIITRRCIDQGETVSDKAKMIGRYLLLKINKALYKESNILCI